MKGLVYHGNEVLKWEEVPDVTPRGNEVKLKVKAAGICGSDVHGFQGITGRRTPPMIMGHEFSGEVIEVGCNVKKLKVGDRVAPYPVDYCGECEYCKKQLAQLCPNRRQFGVLTVDGGFAEYICVPEKVCYKLEEHVSYAEGSTVEPLAVALRAVLHAGDLTNQNVLVVGTGTIGLMLIACIVAQKPKKLIVSDLSENRLEIAKAMGADVVLNPLKVDYKEEVLGQTDGIGVDISFEAVGITPTCIQSVSALRIGGTAVWVGQGKKMVEIGMLEIVTRELTVTGTFMYGQQEFEKAVSMMNQKEIDVKPIISKEVPMSEGALWFEKLKKPDDLIKVVLIEEV